RRERRRRTSGLVAGVATMAVVVVVASTVVRADPGSGAPLDSQTSTPSAPIVQDVLTVWPENALSAVSAAQVQQMVDEGDPDLQWRLDPERVVERLGQGILGRSMRIVSTTRDGDRLVVEAFPCPPGELPSGVSCDVFSDGDLLMLTLVQPVAQADGGIWSIASVESKALSILTRSTRENPLEPGDQVEFHLSFSGATSAHIGIVASNGCRVAGGNDSAVQAGSRSLIVPEVWSSDPSCPSDGVGYVYAYVTDDTTMPSADPINEPTAIEYPWITIEPVYVNMTSESGGPSPSSSAPGAPSSSPADPTTQQATVASITCDGGATRVEGDGTVAAMADGVHLHIENVGGDTQFNIADAAKNVDIAPGRSVDLVQPLDPGEHFVLCGLDGGTFVEKIEVVDPNGYWFDQDPECSVDQSRGADIDTTPLGVEGDPADEILSAASSIFESNIAGSALAAGYELHTGAYPDQAGDRTIVAVDTDGHVIGVVWFRESNADWYPTNYVTCDANVIF
ncbi:MAG: hypothetical protein M3O29_03290, partial [Actinomycetota bacterium]|nr:hypothetical protein [Actinomycetota bacterium]